MNSFGLPRNIPESVRREVRQRCGFGCVVCGSIPYDYDHFRVPYQRAKEHLADDIILLCPHHHRLKTSGIIDNNFIVRCLAVAPMDRACRFKQPGVDTGFKVRWPSIDIDAKFQGVVIDEEPVFQLENQDSELEPVVLNARLAGRDGQEVAKIENNEIVARAANLGDLTVVGNRFDFISRAGQKILSFRLDNSGINIDKIFFVRKGVAIFGNDCGFRLSKGNALLDVTGANLTDTEIAIKASGGAERDFSKVDLFSLRPTMDLRGASASGSYIGIGID